MMHGNLSLKIRFVVFNAGTNSEVPAYLFKKLVKDD